MHRVSIAEYLQAIAALMAAGRFVSLRLSREQPALLAYLGLDFLYLVTLATLGVTSIVYFYAYMVGTALITAISIMAVREMFTLTFERYPGIRSAGRRVMYGATGTAALLALSITAWFNRSGSVSTSHLYVVEILYRSIILTLTFVAVALLVTLLHYPLHLRRNTYVSTLFFSAILLSEAIQLLIDSIHSHLFLQWLDVAQVLFAAACFTGWAFMLRPQEAFTPATRVVFENPHEAELLRQLESLNTLLTRAGRQ